ncbi:MAG: hypothetical protein WBP61_14015, partial [Nocardioides sp.]
HEVFLLLVLPVLVLGALTLPRGVRRVHGPLLPAHLFADQGTAQQPGLADGQASAGAGGTQQHRVPDAGSPTGSTPPLS